MSERGLYEFGAFRLDPEERLLLRGGEPVQLEPKVFETLVALVRRGGRLAGKEELLREVWPDSYVEEGNLTRNISVLRKALQQNDDGPPYIETVPKRGYRFVGEVRALSGEQAELIVQSSKVSVVVEEEESDERGDAATQEGGGVTTARESVAAVEHRQLPSSRLRRRGLVVALALALAVMIGAAVYFGRSGRSNQPIDSVAVLPFANTSNDPNAEYLSDGIPEALINSLTELRQLRVVARTTAFRYKGKEIDPRAVGRELKVRAVLTGRVHQTGDTLDVQVDLVDASTGTQLWGEGYHRRVPDALAVKQAIAREVTEKLKLRLSGEERLHIAKHETASAEAFQFYLRGRYFWNKRNEEGLRKAVEQFQQAIARDPNYALGYVGLADSYTFLNDFTYVKDNDLLLKARAAVDHALKLDNSLAEAHASSALIHRHLWQWPEADAGFKRAVSLNPNYANARIWFSIHYRNQRKFDDALREIRRAQELDPLSPVIGANVAYVLILSNDLAAAVEECQRTLELDPNHALPHEILGIAYLKQRRYEEATAEFQKAVELTKGANNRFLSSLGYCYAVTGRRAEALAIVKELESRYARGEASGQNIAGVYAGLGDVDQALIWLERNFERRGILLPEINWRFAFDGLRGEPRFVDLVRRTGLPQ